LNELAAGARAFSFYLLEIDEGSRLARVCCKAAEVQAGAVPSEDEMRIYEMGRRPGAAGIITTKFRLAKPGLSRSTI